LNSLEFRVGEMARKAAARADGPSQRQLRVGEVLREALIEALARAHFRDPLLAEAHITVSEVRPSPDLRHAKVYVMPLGGENAEALVAALRRAAPYLRAEVNRRVRLKYSPALDFELDSSFDQAHRIDELLDGGPSDDA
jgi:ribosome-binding factor A